VSRRSGNEQAEAHAAANLGEVLVSRGRLDEAEAVLQEARRVLRAQKDVSFALFAETQLGRVLLERGQIEEAILALTRIVDEASRAGHSFIVVDASVHLADAHVRGGDPESALQVIGSAQAHSGEDAVLYEVPLQRVRAQALLDMDRPDEALVHAERALASARQQRLLHEEALLLLIEAEAGLSSNGELFEEASRLLKQLGVGVAQYPRLPSPML
jgi:tetratricopeptide (TPR) repeat protein